MLSEKWLLAAELVADLLPTFGSPYGKVVGLAIYVLYYTVKYHYFWSTKIQKEMFVTDCMHLYELFWKEIKVALERLELDCL